MNAYLSRHARFRDVALNIEQEIELAQSSSENANPSPLVVIVTGGARGLGRAMTLALIRNGVHVAVADLPASAAEARELLNQAAAEGLQDRLIYVECDVTQWQDCVNAVEMTTGKFGAIHGLVNNAGVGMQNIGNVLVGSRKRFYEVEADTWRKAIDANFNGAFMMAKAITPKLIEQGFGRIVNIVTQLLHDDDGRLLALRAVEGSA